jgi:transcriptional regulator with XRE-family HTH domain
MPNKRELGARIKRFRLGRNMTLKEVEVRAKVSATHVSEIERGMTSPTVGALAKIAQAMGTEASYFLQSIDRQPVSIVRKRERRVLAYEGWGAKIHCLSDGVGGWRISFLQVELEPGLERTVQPIRHHGEELIHIIKGVIEINIDAGRHLLKEGDSIHFRSRDPHTIRNIGDGQARIVWVASPPFYL